jgi:hypothetical protein
MANTEKNPIFDDIGSEFLISEPEPKPETKPEDKPAEKKFKREIDLGDGSGKQVFEGATAEELLDALAKAQENATKKIQQQNKELKRVRREARRPQPVVAPDPEIPALTADEEFLVAQELGNKPTQAFKKLFESVTGVKVDSLKSMRQMMAEMAAAGESARAAQDFIEEHADDYHPTPGNSRKLQEYLGEHNLPLTLENLEEAFDELSAAGELRKAPEPKPQEIKPADESRIEKPAEHTPATSSGLSEHSGRREPDVHANQAALTDEDIWSLPMDQARERIAHALHSQRKA